MGDEKLTLRERAKRSEKSREGERAIVGKKPNKNERAKRLEKP